MTKAQLFKLIERQIEVSRFEAHIRRDLLKRLSKLQRQVKGRIGEEDMDNIGKRDLNRLIKDIEVLSLAAHKELIEKVDNYALDLAQNETDFVYREFGVAWGVPKHQPALIDLLILGATTSEWLSKQANDYAHSVKMAIRNNDSVDHLEKQLGNKTKAFTTTLTRSVSQQTQTRIAEKSKKVKGYWHVSALDSRTSSICLVRSNKRWDKDGKPIGHDLSMKEPPLHPHCRSMRVPITDVGKEPATMTVEDWLDSMSEEKQDKVLGKGKAQMYRKGHITLRDLLDQSGRPQSLKTIKRDWFAANSQSELMLVSKNTTRDEKEIKRLLNGASDPKSVSEVNTAVDYQQLKGVTLENAVIENDENNKQKQNPDFVIKESGKTIDAMYSLEGYNEYKRGKMNNFFQKPWSAQVRQIDNHFNKADIVVMDIRLLTKENKDKLLDHVVSLPQDKQKRIELIESE